MIARSSLVFGVAALATISILVPATWHLLDADIQTDGPKIRPAQEVLHLDGADVALQLDRGAVVAGGTVSAVLVATADHAHAVAVDLTTLEDMGYGDERVPNPPRQVNRRKLTLQAQPGGGPPVVATVRLGSRREHPGSMSWYDLYLTPHGERAPKHAWGDGNAAHAGVVSWSCNSFPIAIEPPATIPAEGPFTVAVRIKNTTKQAFTYSYVNVGGTIDSFDEMGGGLQLTSDDYDVAEVDEPPAADAPATEGDDADGDVVPVGAEQVRVFRVVPKHPGVRHFTLIAHVATDNGSAMEIRAFDRPARESDPAPPALAAR
jgi:hypothetical protein